MDLSINTTFIGVRYLIIFLSNQNMIFTFLTNQNFIFTKQVAVWQFNVIESVGEWAKSQPAESQSNRQPGRESVQQPARQRASPTAMASQLLHTYFITLKFYNNL